MSYIYCLQIYTQPINNNISVEELENVVCSRFSSIDLVELVNDESVRQEVLTDFMLASPEGFSLVDPKSLAFRWTAEESHVLDDVIKDIKKELELGEGKELLARDAPLSWFRECVCGWNSNPFIFIDGEVLTKREFFLYSSGPLMNKKTFYIGSIFSCHCF